MSEVIEDINVRLGKIIDGLTKAERRKGDGTVGGLVLKKFTEGWPHQQLASVAQEILNRTRAILRARRFQ